MKNYLNILFVILSQFSFSILNLESTNNKSLDGMIQSLFLETENMLPKIFLKKLPPLKVYFNKEFKDQTIGQYTTDHKIYIKPEFLTDFKKNKMLIIQVLLHEIAHAYDLENFRNEKEVSELDECYKNSKILNFHKNHCYFIRKINSRKNSISDHKKFKKLAHFKNEKAFTQKSSLDNYENFNLEEFFAVNFEYYILDQYYKFKRPNLNLFFDLMFENKKTYRSLNGKIPTISGYIDFNEKKIKSISYLYVDPGSELVSSLGHSMFLVDTDNGSYVLAYSAHTEEASFALLKGVFGKYPLKVSIRPLREVIDEYNIIQNRTILTYELKLNQNEKTALVHRFLEDFWEDLGSYQFFGKNCATAAKDALKAALNNESFLFENSKTPKGLLKALIRENIILPVPTKTFNFNKELFEEVKTIFFNWNDLLDSNYKNHFFRKNLYQTWIKKNEKGCFEKLERIHDIESNFLRKHNVYLKNKLDHFIQNIKDKSHELFDSAMQIKNYHLEIKEKTNIKQKNYGIPLVFKAIDVSQYVKEIQTLKEQILMNKELPESISEEIRILNEIEDNLVILNNAILQSL